MVAIQAAQSASQAKQTEEAESGFREALRLATEAGSEKGRMNALKWPGSDALRRRKNGCRRQSVSCS